MPVRLEEFHFTGSAPVVEFPSTMDNANTLPFRLVIGVTGHRKLEDTKALRQTVNEVIGDILARYPETGSTRVEPAILSPLAEGADRLVAQEVLRRENAILKVILPLEISDYLEDFAAEESKREFKDLLRLDPWAQSLRESPLRADEDPLAALQDERARAYEEAGHFVVDHCDVLICLWDHKPEGGRGGTAAIVEYARRKDCPRYIINTEAPSAYTFTDGTGTTGEYFEKIDEFNRSVAGGGPGEGALASAYGEFFENPEIPEGSRIREDVKSLVRERLLPFYALSSLRAARFQAIYSHTGISVFMLALSATLTVATGAIFFHSSPWAFTLELALLAAIGALLYRADRKKKAHKNWIAYRFLAERLRSSIYVAICGEAVAPVYVSKRTGGDEAEHNPSGWTILLLEEIVRRLASGARQGATGKEQFLLLRSYIGAHWIGGQAGYHSQKAATSATKSRKFERTGEIIYYGAFAGALLHIVLSFVPGIAGTSHAAESLLTLIALILPPVAAAMEAIRGHRKYQELATRSRKMAGVLRKMEAVCERTTPETFPSFVADLDRVMREETEDWISFVEIARLYKAV